MSCTIINYNSLVAFLVFNLHILIDLYIAVRPCKRIKCTMRQRANGLSAPCVSVQTEHLHGAAACRWINCTYDKFNFFLIFRLVFI